MSQLVVLLLALFASALVWAQVPHTGLRQYAVTMYGADVLDPITPALSYINNLRLDTLGYTTPRIWYTADRSEPNLFYAEFNPAGGDHSFWTTAVSPYGSGATSPFLSIDAAEGNVVGMAYPTAVTAGTFGINGASQVLQGAYLNPNNSATMQLYQTYYSQFQFFGVSLPIDHQGNQFGHYSYYAGWMYGANNSLLGYTIARPFLDFATSKLTLDAVADVIAPSTLEPLPQPCFDSYDAYYKPYVGVKSPSQYVVVVYPGACSRIYKVTIPPDDHTMFKDAAFQRLVPVQANEFIASVAFDHQSQILWIAIKTFQKAAVTIKALNLVTFQLTNVAYSFQYDFDPILTSANDVDNAGNPIHYLMVSGAGCGILQRFIAAADGSSLTLSGIATMAPLFNMVASPFYSKPYFYFSTMEANSKIVRIHKSNFCAQDCGNRSYCSLGACNCWPDYTPDPNFPDANGNPRCVSGGVRIIERWAQQETGAAAALGTLFGVALIVGSAGWYLWWRARQMAYSSL